MAAVAGGDGAAHKVGTVQRPRTPEGAADEARLMFEMFDINHDGEVSPSELKAVLQDLNPEVWTDAKVDKVLSSYDTDGDGVLKFTEFWGWVSGHGGRSTEDFKPALMETALEKDKTRREEIALKVAALQGKQAAMQAAADERARKAMEREEGNRHDRKEFLNEAQGVGLSQQVAQILYTSGDEDRDGEIDARERKWLANETAATTGHIRKLYQQCTGVETDAKGNIDIRAVEDEGVDAVVKAFTAWDSNGDGTISAQELYRVLRTLNPRLGEKTVATMIQDMDQDRSGSIDILEFVAWLSGDGAKKKKAPKKAKEERESKLAVALHRQRAREACEAGVQHEFEGRQHEQLAGWCARRKVKLACGRLYLGQKTGSCQMCSRCGDRHAWLCHGCGFVSFSPDCVNGCPFGTQGWSCISGNCAKKCGCKKKPDHWRRAGRVHELAELGASARPAAPPPAGDGDGDGAA